MTTLVRKPFLLFAVLTLTLSQSIPSVWAQSSVTYSSGVITAPGEKLYNPQEEIEEEEEEEEENESVQSFLLKNNNPLQNVDTGAIVRRAQQSMQQRAAMARTSRSQYRPNYAHGSNEFTFEKALDQLQPDYASAVIVTDLTAEDLETLSRQEIEIGLLVVGDKTILFTSGSTNEIRVHKMVKVLFDSVLENAAPGSVVFAHNHVGGASAAPSTGDIQSSGDLIEYLISAEGVYAYNHDGVQDSMLSYEDLAATIEAASGSSSHSSWYIRNLLNVFIQQIDLYNQHPEDSVALRMGPVTEFDGNASLIPVTQNPGAGQAEITQTSHELFTLDYDLSLGSDFVGAAMVFEQTQDISALSSVLFEIRTNSTCQPGFPSRCVNIEFKDINGQVGLGVASNLSEEFSQVSVSTSLMKFDNPALDLTQIKEIVFVIPDHYTDGVQLDGFFEFKTYGIPFEPVINPAPCCLENTNLGYNVEVSPLKPANEDTINFLFQTGLTTIDFGYFFPLAFNPEDKWAGFALNFNDTFDITQEGFNFSFESPDPPALNIEFISNGRKITVHAENLSDGVTYRVDEAVLSTASFGGFNPASIESINFIVTADLVGDPNGVGQLTMHTNGLYYAPAAPTTSDPVTDFTFYSPSILEIEPCSQLGEDPCVSGSLNTVTNVNQADSSSVSFSYDLANGDGEGGRRWGGLFYDFKGQTVTSVPDGIVLGLSSADTSSVMLEFTDQNGVRVSVLAEGLTSSNQNYIINNILLESFGNGFDAFNISGIAIVVNEQTAGTPNATGTINLQTQGLDFGVFLQTTADPVTDLTAAEPFVGEVEPCATANEEPCASGSLNTVTSLNQTSEIITFGYDLANGVFDPGSSDFRDFAGVSINFEEDLPPLAGDANGDNEVTIADYTVWRNHYGATSNPPGLRPDLNGNGVVDAADYTVWRDNFGASRPAALLLDATSGLVIGIAALGNADSVDVVAMDKYGNRSVMTATGLLSTVQNFVITEDALRNGNALIDVTKIRAISFIVDQDSSGSSTTAAGTIQIVTKGLSVGAALAATANPLTDFSGIAPVSGEVEPCTVLNEEPCSSGTYDTVTSQNVGAPGVVASGYNLGNGSYDPVSGDFRKFAGALINFNPNGGGAALAGDADLDGDVDGADFLSWQRNVGNSVPPGTGSDFNGDGTVNGGDLGLWQDNFGTTGLTDTYLDGTGGFVIGLAAVGDTDKVKVIARDADGYEVVMQAAGLTSLMQNFEITEADLNSGQGPFDLTRIEFLIILVDNDLAGSDTATGTFQVAVTGVS